MTNMKGFQAVLTALAITLVSFGFVQVSAQVSSEFNAESNSNKVYTPLTEEYCAGDKSLSGTSIPYDLFEITARYSNVLSKDLNVEKLHADLNDVIKKDPNLINCRDSVRGAPIGPTFAHLLGNSIYAIDDNNERAVIAAKWAISEGLDLTMRWGHPIHGRLPYDYIISSTKHLERKIARYTKENSSFTGSLQHKDYLYRLSVRKKIVELFKLSPAPATRSCAEVDGKKPKADEYCIVAENMQTSFESLFSRQFSDLLGVDSTHIIYSGLSGTALNKGWTTEITFTCSYLSDGCGPSYIDSYILRTSPIGHLVDKYNLSVSCNDSGNLLNVSELDAGQYVTIISKFDTELSSPWYRSCQAKSSGPFTLSIRTTRLAK
ncbi:MAG: hypothetical protein ISN28_02200 [Ectothiorhodospiraceae bacterium AqS1]|nr:hypothetical protein [Ectothiorhodospiraceae bacterium AqS1]